LIEREILRVSGLTKTFSLSAKQQKLEKASRRIKVAVDDVSFTAYRGEIFGLLGPNGAGKTTALRIIATLIKPDRGEVLVDGSSVTGAPAEVRAKIGFLTSELKLEDFFTPNYLFDFFAALHHLPPAVRDRRKRMMFEKFGIDRFAEVKVANLSTGMKQKVSLVISIVHDPAIVIFDEPTNGLDVLTAKVVTDFMRILREEGKTILLSTHIFDLAEKLCDRVGIIFDGKMAACGTLPDITGGRTLEEAFFTLYQERTGEVL